MEYMHASLEVLYKIVKFIVKSKPTKYMHFILEINEVHTNLSL